MKRLACLAVLAAFLNGCKCAKKADDGPVPRPPTVHVWAGLAHLDKTLQSVSAMAAKFGLPAPGKDALTRALAQETGMGVNAVGGIDLGRPVWIAWVKKEGGALAYTYVYAFPIRDEKSFRKIVSEEMDRADHEGVLKLSPKSGKPGKPFFAAIDRGHILVCVEAAPLKVARDFLLRTLVPAAPDSDIAITLARDFLAGWKKDMAGLAEGQNAALAGIVRRMAERVATVKEAKLRASISASEITVGLRLESDSGAMQALVKRQVPGPIYGADLMPADAWLFYTDRHNAPSLAETTLDIKQALGLMPDPRKDEVSKAAVALTNALSGEVAVAAAGSAVLAAGEIKDVAAARKAMDELMAAFAAPREVRRDGHLTIVDLPAGFVPPLVAGPPAIASHIERKRLLFAIGTGAEKKIRDVLAGGGARLDKNASFTKATAPRDHRVGLVYLSVAQLLGTMLAAVPGAPAPPASPDTPGVLLDWAVDGKRTALDVRLRIPTDAFATLGPLVQALPFMGGGRPMPGAPWKQGP